MPKDFIYETAITIDHEDGLMLVGATMAGVANRLLQAGFIEATKPSSKPYRRFQGEADQVRFRKPKGARTLRGRPFSSLGPRIIREEPAEISRSG